MRIIVIIFLFGLSFAGYSQNLVKNGDFEEYYDCPTSFGYLKLPVKYWWVNNQIVTPDYFHECGNYYFTVPQNRFGYFPAQSGKAYIGLVVFDMNDGGYEYIQSELREPMQKGHSYSVSFWVRLRHTSSKYLSNNIGVCFSKEKAFSAMLSDVYETNSTGSSKYYSLDKASVSTYPNFISDTSWVEITGEYIAKGGEKYITFGFFYVDIPEIDKIFEKIRQGKGKLAKHRKLLEKMYLKYFLRENPYNLSDEKLYNERYPWTNSDTKDAYYLFDNVSVELMGEEKDKK